MADSGSTHHHKHGDSEHKSHHHHKHHVEPAAAGLGAGVSAVQKLKELLIQVPQGARPRHAQPGATRTAPRPRATPVPHDAGAFAELDADSDGFVTSDELSTGPSSSPKAPFASRSARRALLNATGHSYRPR